MKERDFLALEKFHFKIERQCLYRFKARLFCSLHLSSVLNESNILRSGVSGSTQRTVSVSLREDLKLKSEMTEDFSSTGIMGNQTEIITLLGTQ